MRAIPARIRQLYYRGWLEACNYSCSYCPFAKRKMDRKKWQADQQAFERFFAQVKASPARLRILLIPYGEALTHPFYRNGMIRLARLPNVEGVSCQTNLSFDAAKFLREIAAAAVGVEKIKLWASFHPEILGDAGKQKFIDSAHQLMQNGVDLAIGAVALARYRNPIAELRRELDPRLYLFLNLPRGIRGEPPLSLEERNFFRAIDPLLLYDEARMPADVRECQGGKTSLFIDAKGQHYACPRSKIPMTDTPLCRRKTCDCYLAYSNRHPAVQAIMGDGALWRIPQKRAIAALFFDIDGTLVDAEGKMPSGYAQSLALLAQEMPLFLATALPVEYAKERLGASFMLFSGGVFAAGAHLIWGKQQHFIRCPTIPQRLPVACRVSAYANAEGEVFKYALTAKNPAAACQLQECLQENYNAFREERLVTLVHKKADKRSGVLRLCREFRIDPGEIAVMGDSDHDLPMCALTPYACAVPNASAALCSAAWLILTPDRLPAFFTGRR